MMSSTLMFPPLEVTSLHSLFLTLYMVLNQSAVIRAIYKELRIALKLFIKKDEILWLMTIPTQSLHLFKNCRRSYLWNHGLHLFNVGVAANHKNVGILREKSSWILFWKPLDVCLHYRIKEALDSHSWQISSCGITRLFLANIIMCSGGRMYSWVLCNYVTEFQHCTYL